MIHYNPVHRAGECRHCDDLRRVNMASVIDGLTIGTPVWVTDGGSQCMAIVVEDNPLKLLVIRPSGDFVPTNMFDPSTIQRLTAQEIEADASLVADLAAHGGIDRIRVRIISHPAATGTSAGATA